jgi:hypothetical protein
MAGARLTDFRVEPVALFAMDPLMPLNIMHLAVLSRLVFGIISELPTGRLLSFSGFIPTSMDFPARHSACMR